MKTNLPNNTPHNDFFYSAMSRKDFARDFFAKYLPQNLQKVVDLATLSLCESKSISDKSKSLYKDVLYKCLCPENQTTYLYVLCEHQSNLEKHMPLRILEYNTSIIQKHLKNKGATYPLFANFVVYHGKKPWTYSTCLGDYYPIGEERLYMAPLP